MKNILLFLFDYIIILPITLIRLLLIYFFGSKYNIPSISFLDVMMHADNKYFNQEEINPTIDTIKDDIRLRINYDSRCNKDVLMINNNKKCSRCQVIFGDLMQVIQNNKEDNNDINDINKEKKNNDIINSINTTLKTEQTNINYEILENNNSRESVFTKKTNKNTKDQDTDTLNLKNLEGESDNYIFTEYNDGIEIMNEDNENIINKYINQSDNLNQEKQKLLFLLDKFESV